MHVLFDDVIAREPGEVQPVAQLPLDVAPRRLAILLPESALVPRAARGEDLSDPAVLDALQRLEVPGLVAALRARRDAEPFRPGLVGEGEHLADARAVNRDRLLREDVLARSDRRLEMRGAETRRGGENDVVRVGREHPPIGVEADELPLLRHVHLCRVFLADLHQGGGQAIGEGVAHRDELHALGAVERIQHRAGAAAAAADQADPDRVASGCERAGNDRSERRVPGWPLSWS